MAGHGDTSEARPHRMRRLVPRVSYVARLTLYLAEVLLLAMVLTLMCGTPAPNAATPPGPVDPPVHTPEQPSRVGSSTPRQGNAPDAAALQADAALKALAQRYAEILKDPRFTYTPIWQKCAIASLVLLLLATHSIAWLSVNNRAVRIGFALLFVSAYAVVAVPFAQGSFGVAWLAPWLAVWPLHVPVVLGLCSASKSGLARQCVPVYMDHAKEENSPVSDAKPTPVVESNPDHASTANTE